METDPKEVELNKLRRDVGFLELLLAQSDSQREDLVRRYNALVESTNGKPPIHYTIRVMELNHKGVKPQDEDESYYYLCVATTEDPGKVFYKIHSSITGDHRFLVVRTHGTFKIADWAALKDGPLRQYSRPLPGRDHHNNFYERNPEVLRILKENGEIIKERD